LGDFAVEMDNVTYAYPDGYMALQEVNLSIGIGERVGIVGPNGAGKSTLLIVMNGLYKPLKGTVRVFGRAVTAPGLSGVRQDVGIVFQDPDDQLFSPTLWEDVCFGPSNMGLPKEEVRKRTMNALKMVGLDGYEEKPPHHLSAGEKKRAALATVLAMQPRILVLDEPTANLDPKSRKELISLLQSLRSDRDMTFVTATHDVNFLPEAADRVHVLNKGRMIAEGPLREIFSSSKIMDEANLEPPIITQLFKLFAEKNGISIESLPFNFEEAVSELSRCCMPEENKRSRVERGRSRI